MDILETQATLHYESGSFQIIRHGSFVICAVTGKRIPLQELRYWNADRQEAYIDAETATKRHQELTGI